MSTAGPIARFLAAQAARLERSAAAIERAVLRGDIAAEACLDEVRRLRADQLLLDAIAGAKGGQG